MAHQRSNGKYKQDKPAFKWQSKGVHALTKAPDAAAYVAKAQRREAEKLARKLAIKATAPVLSDTDWAAFPLASSPHAPKMAGLAKGLGGEVVHRPITDSARLIEAAARIGRAA